MRLTLMRNAFVLSGAGVGGGSLVYANTLYEPPATFYDDPQWAHITDWKSELEPFYDQAKRMLGVVRNAHETPADVQLREVAEELGVGHTYRSTPVGVLFGTPGTPAGAPVSDPFFGGAGPRRNTCTLCGQCMVGCRVGAKNSLIKNYLYLAERAGATVHPLTTVRAVRPLDAEGNGSGYAVDTVRTGLCGARRRRTFTAEQVIFAAASLGTQQLLHRMRDKGHLTRLPPRLGELSRTNSEAIIGMRARHRRSDHSHGVAITSSIHPDAVTHIEAVRYGQGSNLMALLTAPLVDGDRRLPRWLLARPVVPAVAVGELRLSAGGPGRLRRTRPDHPGRRPGRPSRTAVRGFGRLRRLEPWSRSRTHRRPTARSPALPLRGTFPSDPDFP